MNPEEQVPESGNRKAADVETKANKLPPKTSFRILLSLILATALLVFVLRGVDFKEVGSHISSADTLLILFAMVAYYASYAVRAARWSFMIRSIGGGIGFGTSLVLILSSYAVNCLVPAKAGDIYRSYFAAEKGSSGMFKILGTVAAERVADLICVLAAFALGAALVFSSANFYSGLYAVSEKLLWSLGAAVILIFVVVTVIAKIDKVLGILIPKKFASGISPIKTGFFAAISRPWAVFGFTIAIWILELGCFGIALAAVGVGSDFAESLFVSSASTLSNAVPFTPGGLGAYELAAREILNAAGREMEPIIAAIIIIRLINYWSLLLLGGIAGVFAGLRTDIKRQKARN